MSHENRHDWIKLYRLRFPEAIPARDRVFVPVAGASVWRLCPRHTPGGDGLLTLTSDLWGGLGIWNSRAEAEAMLADPDAAPNSGSAGAVAPLCAKTGGIAINRAMPREGHDGVATMAAGYFGDVPDLSLVCDKLRIARDRLAYLRTFTGNRAQTRCALRLSGCKEWALDDMANVPASRGWFSAAEYARQVEG